MQEIGVICCQHQNYYNYVTTHDLTVHDVLFIVSQLLLPQFNNSSILHTAPLGR